MRRQSWPDVRVACVWIAQLPLRVEILRHPAWDGRPLVLGGAPGERKVVQLCPEAIVLQPDPVRIAAVRETVLADLHWAYARRVASRSTSTDQMPKHMCVSRPTTWGHWASSGFLESFRGPLQRGRVGL